jgi:hypothetical protein
MLFWYIIEPCTSSYDYNRMLPVSTFSYRYTYLLIQLFQAVENSISFRQRALSFGVAVGRLENLGISQST